jgi:hypothetical protein
MATAPPSTPWKPSLVIVVLTAARRPHLLFPGIGRSDSRAAGKDPLKAEGCDCGRAGLAPHVLRAADGRTGRRAENFLRAGLGDRGIGGAAAGENELDAVDRRVERYAVRGNELHAADIDRRGVGGAAVVDSLLAPVRDCLAERRAEDALRLSESEGAARGRAADTYRADAHHLDGGGKRKRGEEMDVRRRDRVER